MELEGIDESTMNKYDRPDNRKSLIGRFRKVRKAQTPTSTRNDKRDQTPSPPLESYPTATARRDGAPSRILVAQSSDSTALDAVKSPTVKSPTTPTDPWDRKTRETKSKLKSTLPIRESVTLAKPPSAQEAAFGGPPRFDWIDIVSFNYCLPISDALLSFEESSPRRPSWWRQSEVLALKISPPNASSSPTIFFNRVIRVCLEYGIFCYFYIVLSGFIFLHTCGSHARYHCLNGRSWAQ